MAASLLPDDPHDRDLLANVRPADWRNPAPASRYHLVVVGGGTAGLVCAAGAAGLGARVALVEKNLLGGDCLNVGCVPSKALIAASRSRELPFPEAMRRMRQVRASLSTHDSAERFKSLGVDVFLGQGTFTGSDTLAVDGQALRFRRAVVATGTRADALGLEGVLTNEDVFNLTALPRTLAVIGAGPIGCELAQAFARFGSRVTLFDRGPRILHREDEDAARLVLEAMRADGVAFVPNAKPEDALRLGADAVLVAAGRKPNTEGLGLEAAGVAHTAKGVTVNDRLRTANPRVYAAGDIAGSYAFTHAADAMARIVIRNALFWGWRRLSALVVPWCTYTTPELGRAGLSLDEARKKGIAVDSYEQAFSGVDRARLDGHDAGFVRVLARKGTGKIVGATVVGTQAGELAGVLALAMGRGLGLGDLSSAVFPYPTRNEALRKVGDAYGRSRLTPWARRLLGWWLGRA